MQFARKTLVALLLPVVLEACSLAPEYHRPESPIEATLPAAKGATSSGQLAAETGWRQYFTDPRLQGLIELALANNRDLRQAALNVQAYQAQYRIQRAELYPIVGAAGEYAKQRNLSGERYVTGEAYTFAVGLTAYELDLFGRVRSLNAQALEQYLAMEESRRSAQISLVAEVARAYLTWLADRQLVAITGETAASEQASFALIERRVNEGISTQIDLAQARTSLENARANLAKYRRQLDQDVNLLTLLVGAPVNGALPEGVELDRQALSTAAPAGLSSELLLKRPDIMAAEHSLLAANANIGAARAAFFPTITLTASAGWISPEMSGLFDGSSGTWLLAPSIRIPLFTAGRLAAQLDVAELRKEISVAQYEKAIQTAFRETADALVATATYDEQLRAQEAGLAASQDYYNLARNRYEQGVDSYLTLLDAQRSLYNARQGVVATRLAQLVNRVNLYKALGGGWKE